MFIEGEKFVGFLVFLLKGSVVGKRLRCVFWSLEELCEYRDWYLFFFLKIWNLGNWF